MTFPRALSKLAQLLSSSGIVTAAGGGTGLSAPGTSGNVLTSDGTGWVSSPPAGGGGGGLVPIQTITTAANQTNITFSSIPQTYKALVLRIAGRCNAGNTGGGTIGQVCAQVNGNTVATDYAASGAYNSVTTYSISGTLAGAFIGEVPWSGDYAYGRGVIEATMPSYTDTTFNKVWLTRWYIDNVGAVRHGQGIGLLGPGASAAKTAAVTQLDLIIPSSYWINGATATLYGIA